MAVFPDGAPYKPLLPYRSGDIENVRRNPSESGSTQIRDLWGGETKFWAEMDIQLGLSYANVVRAFWSDYRASTFTFFDFDPERFSGEVIGTGDGATLAFIIPAKETAAVTVEVESAPGVWVAKSEGLHYSISAASGPVLEDRVIFTAGNAPAAARRVRVTYDGRHCYYSCEFMVYEKTTVSSTGRKRLHIRIEEAF